MTTSSLNYNRCLKMSTSITKPVARDELLLVSSQSFFSWTFMLKTEKVIFTVHICSVHEKRWTHLVNKPSNILEQEMKILFNGRREWTLGCWIFQKFIWTVQTVINSNIYMYICSEYIGEKSTYFNYTQYSYILYSIYCQIIWNYSYILKWLKCTLVYCD